MLRKRTAIAAAHVAACMCALVSAAPGAGAAPVAAAAGSKPHLVFILQDDLGHFDVAFNGNEAAAVITANISKLATEGIILRSHYVHWHCSPSRSGLLGT